MNEVMFIIICLRSQINFYKSKTLQKNYELLRAINSLYNCISIFLAMS